MQAEGEVIVRHHRPGKAGRQTGIHRSMPIWAATQCRSESSRLLRETTSTLYRRYKAALVRCRGSTVELIDRLRSAPLPDENRSCQRPRTL